MRIGLINQIHGRPDGDRPPPTWVGLRERAITAERAGFDSFVYEDALLYRGETTTDGCWEAVAVSGALAAATTRIEVGPSVFNAPYRTPAMLAKIAVTLDEIADGRFIFGLGAGNTADSDYLAFGFPTDHRYSRFAEAIQIIHDLLKTGHATFDGRYHSVFDSELVLTGPREGGPPIMIAAGGPKMLGLVAEYGDAWNWWTWDETVDEATERLSPIIASLDRACEAIGRDPSTLRRTLDLYSVVAPGTDPGEAMEKPVGGSVDAIAASIRAFGALGFDEVRCDLTDKTTGAIEAMAPVVEAIRSA